MSTHPSTDWIDTKQICVRGVTLRSTIYHCVKYLYAGKNTQQYFLFMDKVGIKSLRNNRIFLLKLRNILLQKKHRKIYEPFGQFHFFFLNLIPKTVGEVSSRICLGDNDANHALSVTFVHGIKFTRDCVMTNTPYATVYPMSTTIPLYRQFTLIPSH